MLKRNLILVVVMLNIFTLTAHAEKCEEVLNKCDAALNAEKVVVSAQKELISKQAQQIDLLNKDIDLERERSNAWYRNPLIVGPSAILIFELLKGVLARPN